MSKFDSILLRANSIEGIVKADITDYPEADIMRPRDFQNSLKDCGEGDIFTMILPAGTDGIWEELDQEYGIR